MQLVKCKTCKCDGQGSEVHYIVKTKNGPRPRMAVRPPEGWGMRAISGETVMFCSECKAKLASGEMRLNDAS